MSFKIKGKLIALFRIRAVPGTQQIAALERKKVAPSEQYNTVSHTIYTSSKNAVVIPYSVLQRMVAAKDCRLRIHTSKGYQDINFSTEHIPGGKATAIVSMGSHVARVVELMPFLRGVCRRTLDSIVRSIESRTHLKRDNFREEKP